MGHKHHHDHTQQHGSDQENPKIEKTEAALQDRIRQRAYELFQAMPGGSDTHDWLQAEREILREMTSQDKSSTATGKGNAKSAAASG